MDFLAEPRIAAVKSFEVPAGSFSAVLSGSFHVSDEECDRFVVTPTKLGVDNLDDPLLDVFRCKGKVWGVCFFPGS